MNNPVSVSVLEFSQKEIAAAFRLSTRQIRNWEKDGCPRKSDGTRKFFMLDEVIAWRLALEAEKAEAVVADAMDAARLRKLEADAAMKELDLSVKRNELVPIDEVEVLLREALESVDSVLRHSSSRVAPRLSKDAGIPIKGARTIMEDVIESVRGLIRAGDDDG